MIYERQKLPTVNEMGRALESEALVAFGKRAHLQTGDNCADIAARLAEMFGYVPLSRREVTDGIFAINGNRQWGFPLPPRLEERSLAYLVVRRPDNASQVHLAFGYSGREYNYGPGIREGFEEHMRIPLRKA